ncbi:MAG: HAMP domain-containing sensor histidine kinase [Oligoflexia bacterium]|nr:HAMP domain-containing sensor histidine kinase [Oligoflexia bacterium]
MKTLQKQLSRLLIALLLVTGLNSVFLWKTLTNLYQASEKLQKNQRVIALATDLERGFFEEDKLRSIEPDEREKKQLNNVRNQIKSDLNEILNLIDDKQGVAKIREIQNFWKSSKDHHGTTQLMIFVRSFIANQQKFLKPLEEGANDATKATTIFAAIYFIVFGVILLILNSFLQHRLFIPMGRLSEKMKDYQAGNYQLPPPDSNEDEVGQLEARFYEMAGRVGQTVTELKEIDRVKTDFISIASHELRTPMTSVKGSLSLILSGTVSDVNPEVKDLLTIAEKETDRLIRLINDILDLTKMESKKLSIDKKWHMLNEVVETAVSAIQGLLEITKVKIQMTFPNVQYKAFMDRDRITQVITNLLSNAAKFSPAGSMVTIGYEPYENGIMIYVSDQGPGIANEHKDHVFEKFRSTDAGKSKIIRGTGLGLPICKALVEQHGGRIGLESEFGKGATFYFILTEAVATTQYTSNDVTNEEAA